MDIVSWNIQAAKGVDGIVSVQRIADTVNQLGDAQLICLQEVLRTTENNQVKQLEDCFPNHELYFGAAVNRLTENGRLEFGNVILSKLPVLQVVYHKLPQPAEPQAKHMPRQAIELIFPYNNKPVRLVCTHLEFFAAKQRASQVQYLHNLFTESTSRYDAPSPDGGTGQFMSVPETANTIFTGDFNMTVDSDEYTCLLQHDGKHQLFDCWRLVHGEKPHDPTCGIFDHEQWQQGAHSRDFFFVSTELSNDVTDMQVDTNTAASDHQPLLLTLR